MFQNAIEGAHIICKIDTQRIHNSFLGDTGGTTA